MSSNFFLFFNFCFKACWPAADLMCTIIICTSHTASSSSAQVLQAVFQAIVVNKLTYASPAWWGLTSADDRMRLEVFLRRCHRLGYCDDTSRTFNSICADADERLFNSITSNRRHLLHPLLPPQQEQHYLLRKRSHGYKLPEHSSSLNDSNFLTTMLYKNINRFDDICWHLPLYFILIVWLRFVNHLLN